MFEGNQIEVKLERNGYLHMDTFVAVKIKFVIVEEIVSGECEDKLLVPHRREM